MSTLTRRVAEPLEQYAASQPPVPTVEGASDILTPVEQADAARRPSQPLAQVLEHRTSRTHDLGAVSRIDVAAILYRAARVLVAGTGEGGQPWSHRPAASAGGCHPFDLLLIAYDVAGLPAGAYRYLPFAAQLRAADLPPGWIDRVRESVRVAARRETDAPATIVLVGDVRITTRRYEQASTLILRDAGALLMTLALAACDLGLEASIVGNGGHRLRSHSPAVLDFGGIVLGRSLQPAGCLC